MTNVGSGYTTVPTATATTHTGCTTTPTYTAVVTNGSVTSLTLGTTGVACTAITITIGAPAGGTTATAGTVTLTNGAVSSIAVSGGGTLYGYSPTVSISGGTGYLATDARGFLRPTSGTSDLGAVQTNPSLSFTTQPVSTTTGTTFSPSPAVQYLDTGYTISSASSPIYITLSLDPGILSGSSVLGDTSGTATYSTLSSSTQEASTVLVATAGTGANTVSKTSNSFSILTTETITATSPTVAWTGSTPSGLNADYVVSPTTGLSFTGGTAPTCTSATGSAASWAPGTYTDFQCSGAVLSGYSFSYGSAGTLTITAVSETITANPQTVTYDGTLPALTYTVSPTSALSFSGGTAPTCTSTLNGAAGSTVSSTPGTHTGDITCSGAVLTGYSFSYAAGTLTENVATLATVAVTGFPTADTNQSTNNATVTMKDSSGNAILGYTGTVTLLSSDPLGVPSSTSWLSYMFSGSENGVHNFPVTLNTAGAQSLTATGPGAISGSETGIAVSDLIWVVNSNGTLSLLSSAGGTGSGYGSSGSSGTAGTAAFDSSGNIWSVTAGSSTLSEVSETGSTISSGYTGGGLNNPAGVTVDGSGMVWVVNSGTSGTGANSLSLFNSSGTAITPATGYTGGSISAPTGIAIDNAGVVWVANSGNNSVTAVLGGAAPVTIPTVNAVSSNALGVKP